jgi:serum/glucocorticoid-regulated kinase 2
MIQKQGHGKSMDWYLLGALLHEMLTSVPPYYDRDKKVMMKSITRSSLKLPNYISFSARSLLSGLLIKDPSSRLGSRGAEEIKQHEFFEGIDWGDVYCKQLAVPKPPVKKTTYIPRYEEVYGFKSAEGAKNLENWSFVS